MGQKNNKNISEFSNNLSRLFDETEIRIIEAEKNAEQEKYRKEIEEKELRLKRQQERKLKTEGIANSIIELIYNILSNAKTRTGDIKSVDENLGRLSDDYLYRSYYSIDDGGLTICLNYSNEYEDKDHYGHGKCFLGEYKQSYQRKADVDDNGVDYTYLKKILSKYGISIERQQPPNQSMGSCRENDIVIIKVSRDKEMSTIQSKDSSTIKARSK